jgi:hypothetical protein
VDGVHQKEVDLRDPAYPTPGDLSGAVIPVNRYVLADDFEMSTLNRVSLGIDQRLASRLQASITYAYIRGGLLARGLNLNAPVNRRPPGPAVWQCHRGDV